MKNRSGRIPRAGLAQGWAAAIERKFPGHARVVARYALLLALILGVTDEFFLRELERGAHLHDIGKAGFPRSVLCKIGPLAASGFPLDN
jgi:HD-GYP domain-containing protein (c-di-GMP phosphodiesterase class II)